MKHIETDALFLAAYAHFQKRELNEARQCCLSLLALNPQHSDTLHLLGVVYHQQGDTHQGIVLVRQALAADPQRIEPLNSLGVMLRHADLKDEALAAYQQALALQPDYVEALYNLGGLLKEMHRLEESRDYYEKVLALKPDYAEAHNNLGNTLKDLKAFEAAEAAYHEALRLQPNHAEAWDNLGLLYQEWGKDPLAMTAYAKAITLKPHWAEPYFHLGLIMLHNGLGTVAEIQRYFEQALALAPQHLGVKASYAMLKLLEGQLPAGWADYEARLQLKKMPEADCALPPLWQGEALKPGTTLLVLGEQGLGDSLQFARYFPLLKQQGITLIFKCIPAIKSLLAHYPGIDTLILPEEVDATAKRCDYYCYLMSLPALFNTSLENIPPVLPAETWIQPEWQIPWQSKLAADSQFKIGIVWASKQGHPTTHYRSCPAALFAALGQVPGVSLYSFQKGPQAVELATLQAQTPVVDLAQDFNDFTETSGALLEMDLIITVDTVLAHLAGSLQKPVWVLLPARPDWRWLLTRDDSPWYPTARLFRQPHPGDWPAVFKAVQQALCTELIASTVRKGRTTSYV